MSYKTILVHLELNGDNEGVLSIAGQLAERFNSRVIGIAAAKPLQPLYEEGYVMAEVVATDRTELDQELAACRVQFRNALESRVKQIEWRSCVTFQELADYIADEARSADLIITGKDIGAALFGNNRRVNIGDLALRAGRPVLIVPQGFTRLALRHVFLAWKDSREARRAAMDGLPLMAAAGHVTVLEVAGEGEGGKSAAEVRVQDVALWLEQHGISGAPMVSTANDQTGQLHALLLDRKCDLLVAGAYGHNRLGEWVFGGVTQDVLLDPEFCVLLSH
jgi:nucleotide-binding universal stress UspA family protein